MRSFAQWGNDLYAGRTSYNIIGNRKKFVTIGLSVIIISLILMVFPGLNPSIDFKGGTEFQISGAPVDQLAPARKTISKYRGGENAQVTDLGTSGVRVQTEQLNTKDQRQARKDLAAAYNLDAEKVTATTIGPSWGADVTKKALLSLVIFLVLVGIVMTLYFRTWAMSFSALFALLHDLTITGGVFALARVEVSPATIIGLLTILGYSLYDTVVVFDKVRELTKDFQDQRKYTYGELVNLAVNQTLVRSINTSVVAILPVGAILVVSTIVLGGGTLRDISLALFVGTIVGTASSILIASPMLVMIRNRHFAAHNEAVAARRRGEDVDIVKNEDGKTVVAKPVVPGRHLGQDAQPKRRSRSKR
ncbi:MAG: protein translocase subunit SecF [Actinomycetaceae bacterium]|nr:protein translocase subunit SecF [Actinomycetaceae bacterium]